MEFLYRDYKLKINIVKQFLYLLSFILFISCGTIMPQQSQYRTHLVAQGETVYSIAQQYGVSQEIILDLNPEARNGIYPNTTLKVPRETSIFDNADIHFKEHKVEAGQTLYSIAKEFQVSEDVIKRFNKHLYSEPIRAGEVIRIPVKIRDGFWVDEDEIHSDSEATISGITTHTVKSKETLSSIAREYDTSVDEIQKLNPTLDNILSEGTILLIPNKAASKKLAKEEGFIYYEVEQAEGFFRIQQRFGLTKEEIIKYNPLAGDGLKKGMVLKIPIDNPEDKIEEEVILENTLVDLKEHMTHLSTKKIALMLPLRLTRVQDQDSIEANSKLLQKDATLRVALDFYRGAVLAAEEATKLGLPVTLQVFDTEGSPNKVSQIISTHNFKEYDAVIGPVLAPEVERAARDLQKDNIAVFSPLTNRVSNNYRNLFQTLPTSEMLEKKMYDYIEKNATSKNVIFITDLNASHAKYRNIRALAANMTTITPTEKGFLYLNEVQPFLSKEHQNWVILESQDPLLVSNVVGMLNGVAKDYDMQLMTTDKNSAYEYHDVSNRHLARLKFTFPSINKNSILEEDSDFVTQYEKKYNAIPNRYVIRGYDLTLDVLLRLASDKNIYKASDKGYYTEYIENKFQYSVQPRASYKNHSGYIVQFTSDLNLKVLE